MMPHPNRFRQLRNWFAAQWDTSAAGWIGIAAAVAVIGTVLVARTPVREEHKAPPPPDLSQAWHDKRIDAVPAPVVVPPPPPVTAPVTTEFHPKKPASKRVQSTKQAPAKAVAKPVEHKVEPKKKPRPFVPVAERRKLAQCKLVPSMAYDNPVEKVLDYAKGMTPALGPKKLRTLRWCIGG